jgi:hypothetical protein
MSRAGKKQDHDCPFSLATTHVVIAASPSLVRPSRSGSICELSQIRLGVIGASGGSGGGGGGSDGEGKVPPESHVREGKTQSGIKS